MDKTIDDVIARAVNDAERYPFLFIGSGLSRRYTGSPDWEGLLKKVVSDVLGNEFAYARYDAQALADVRNGKATSELPHVATLMEGDIDRALLEEDRFSEFRNRHREELLSQTSPLKAYVADIVSGFEVRHSEETGALSRAGRDKVSGVITTNYDSLCSEIFRSYETYVGERALLFSEPSFAQEIYQIHGSVRDPNSMVLTDADYAEFSERRKYLAAKLLTIFVEYPVIFLGYSIQDENVKSILADVCACVPKSEEERLRNRLIFVQYGKGTAMSDYAMDFQGRMLPMVRIATNDFMSIYEALLKSRRMYSTKVIRELRGSVFKLAERIDPSSEVVTAGFDAVLNRMEPDQKIAIEIAVSPAGIGMPISREDIFEDVVLDNLHQDPRFIVENYLAKYIRSTNNIMPVFKYIQDMGDNVEKGVLAYARSLDSLDSFRTKSIRHSMESTRKRFEGHTTVLGLRSVCEPGKLFYFIPHLHDNEIDADELEEVLRDALLATESDPKKHMELLKDTHYRKCVRIYDFLRYGPK